MTKTCLECGKEIKEETDSLYCQKCDEKLDKQFEVIEDNIVIYKELMPNEIEVLNKFEKEDIIEMYIRIYDKFREEGDFTGEQAYVLNCIQNTFSITESDIGRERIVEFSPGSVTSAIVKDECPDCAKKVKEDFSFCPYCGCRLKL